MTARNGRVRRRASRPRKWPGGPAPSGRKLIAWLLVAVVAAVTALGLARITTNTTASAFLAEDDPALIALTASAQAFGGDPVVILLESAQPGAMLDGDQLLKLLALEGRLAGLPDVAVVYGPGTLLNQIAGAAHKLMEGIFARRDASRAQAEEESRAAGGGPQAIKAAGDAAIAEFDLRYGPLVVQAMPAGVPTLRNSGFVNAVVFDKDGHPRPSWRFLVPTPNAVAILVRPRANLDQAGTERLVESARAVSSEAGLPTSRLTVSGTPAVFADLGRTVQREIPLLGALALLLIIASYVLVPWTRRRHRLIPLVATFGATALTLASFGWLGIELSLGAVAFLPILIGIGSDFPAYVVHGAPRRRVVVTATASAAGFASLALSPLPFVRDLGLALAVGVLTAVGIAMLLRRFVIAEPHGDPGDPRDPGTQGVPGPPAAGVVRPAPSWRLRAAVLVPVVLVAALGWVVFPRMEVQARPDQLARGLQSVSEAQHAEEVVGSSGEVDVVLRGPNVATVEALAWMRQAQENVVRRYGSSLRPAASLPDMLAFLGPTPSQEQLDAGLNALPRYLVAAVLSHDNTQAMISLGISLQDLRDQQALLSGLRGSLPPTPPGTTAEVVGLPVAAARGYEQVSRDGLLANVVGIGAAGVVLLVGLRRRSDAIRAVLAAALATGWGLAGIWLLGIPLSPLSVALGSLTVATACEFAVLLGYADSGHARHLRRTVGVAALAAALGYLALTASELALLVQFGFLLAATVGLSFLAAALVVRLLPESERAPLDSGPRRSARPEEVRP